MISINTQKETARISGFIKTVLNKTGYQNVIIAVSGGIDSATSLFLLAKTIPLKNIFVTHLYYFEDSIELFKKTIEPLNLPESNILLSPIRESVDVIAQEVGLSKGKTAEETMRLGNIMARMRMIYLYDCARKHQALVCGTENKSEYHLGYFTRFGDAASDFEPIQHLYKTQIRQLAEYLEVSEAIRTIAPTAGLWEGQTDEGELGFTYEEADQVFHLYYDKKLPVEEIVKKGLNNALKIVELSKKNSFKHAVPYLIHEEVLAQ